MPSGCPSNDPDDDTEITTDCDPEDYFVNKALHDCMIWLSSPFKADDVDVELELFVVGGRHQAMWRRRWRRRERIRRRYINDDARGLKACWLS